MKSTHAVERAGGPSYKTVKAIERGNVGEISSLAKFAMVTHVTLVDLFRSILRISPEESSPELEFVVRSFKNADVVGREALVSTARLAEARRGQRSGE